MKNNALPFRIFWIVFWDIAQYFILISVWVDYFLQYCTSRTVSEHQGPKLYAIFRAFKEFSKHAYKYAQKLSNMLKVCTTKYLHWKMECWAYDTEAFIIAKDLAAPKNSEQNLTMEIQRPVTRLFQSNLSHQSVYHEHTNCTRAWPTIILRHFDTMPARCQDILKMVCVQILVFFLSCPQVCVFWAMLSLLVCNIN